MTTDHSTGAVRPAHSRRTREALEAAGLHGGFFEMRGGPATAFPPADGWRALADLYDPTRPRELAERVAHVGGRLGTDRWRVAASVFAQGLAARLCSPLIACAAQDGLVPELDPRRVLWRVPPGGSLELGLRWAGEGPAGRAPAPDLPPAEAMRLVVDVVREELVDRHLAPLGAALRAQGAISERVLLGNAASAVAAAARLLGASAHLTGHGDPLGPPGGDLAARAWRIAHGLLTAPPFDGLGRLAVPAGALPGIPAGRAGGGAGAGGGGRSTDAAGTPPDGAFYRRHSCCLYHLVPATPCGDCVLHAPGRPRGRQ
ncbi:ferric iron reductase [Allostreptomyces psammosilenae]|uniref:Aerobactin siderophore biosynthesis IucA/IucC-like C-terminal domain-containing protein n=1 Tax=Allostreptomyces psammosilenae TaxID=1892865 RepID=A0A852ZNZ9_9ACTN|nr:ferric iron reductase [Allostreptomyces psammosilenae]NYI04176.1 hypothetical protein [Allostreptomyces psammosilenae]